MRHKKIRNETNTSITLVYIRLKTVHTVDWKILDRIYVLLILRWHSYKGRLHKSKKGMQLFVSDSLVIILLYN